MRPTFAEIDLSAIAHNIRAIKDKVNPAEVMAVVKADAYGHGAIQVAQTAIQNGATYLGVALVEEGIELRENGIEHPILVFGGAFENQLMDFIKYNLEITVYTKTIIQELSRLASAEKKSINIHIKVDTGMGRVGVPWSDALPFIEEIKDLQGIHLKGLYTHFATSDEMDKSFSNLQFDRFEKIIAELQKKNINIPIKHAANSGAILDLPNTYLDLVRPGVMMYGYYPSNETTKSIPIRPAMVFKSRVSYLKEIPENTSVSYGRKYYSKTETRIATIPVGYADGYNRLLSNRAMVTIHGKKFPVVGRVCMDLILVDIGKDDSVKAGDEVILFGKEEENAFTVYDICQLINTIPYEVTCWISKRVPRFYLK